MNKAGKWEQWQCDYVTEHYADGKLSEISKVIGRSKNATSHYASRNGLKKNPDAEYFNRSEARRGEAVHNFKGYRRLSSKGYILRYAPWHPNASPSGLVMEHRLVMEGLIGRLISSDEVVHHINGNKSDNSPSNLELMKFGEHSAFHNSSRKYPPRIKVFHEGQILSGVETCKLLGISAKTVSKWYYLLGLTSIEQMKNHIKERGMSY